MNNNKDHLSIPEAANLCAVSRWTIWKYVRSKELNAFRTPGGHYRISKSDLDLFMREKGMVSPLTHPAQENRILIVDDDPRIQNLYKKILSEKMYCIEIASNGFEAGTKILQFKPDVVILDLFMPGMDGFEVCKLIKKTSDMSHIKVLIITGRDTDENKERIMTAGADDYMVKPVMIKTLKNSVERLLKSKKEDDLKMECLNG